MRARIWSVIALLIINLSPAVFANDTAFGGSGATPMPIKQPNVAMLDENIVITGNDITRSDMKGKWIYACDYTFKNLSNNLLVFQMGFPFPVNDELGETTIPAGYTLQKGDALVYDFKVSVNNNKVNATKYKITPLQDMNYQEAYIWQINMSPSQTVKIHHRYVTGITVNSMGQYYVTFVLKTGGLWKGNTIGHARFEVIPNTPTRMCSELENNADYLNSKPPGIQTIGWRGDRRYIWDLTNFNPKDDLELCLITAKNYVHYYIVNPIVQSSNFNNMDIKKMKAKELRLFRNAIYAQYGRQFQDPDLQNYFNEQWWYEINPQYSDALLTEDDKKAVDILTQREEALSQG